MKQNRATVASYAAGVIDSDGTIGIAKYQKPDSVNPQYILRVSVSQGDGRILDFLLGNFGGFIRDHTKSSQFSNGEYRFWKWGVDGPHAGPFLKAIYPFLRYKKGQAKVAVEFQAHVEKYKWMRVTPGLKGLQPLPPGEVAFRERAYQRLKALKHEFVPPKV